MVQPGWMRSKTERVAMILMACFVMELFPLSLHFAESVNIPF
jgi:hypothetical protein